MLALLFITAPMVYIATSLFIGINALYHPPLDTAAYVLGCSLLAPVALGGAILGMKSKPYLSLALGALGVAATVWMGLQFDITLFGITVSGLVWALCGYGLGAFQGIATADET